MTAERRRLFALIALVIGSGAAILDGTVVTLALPHITSNLSQQQWITNAYLLSLSSLILLGGSLGDIFGRKKIYLTGLVGFGIASLLCALSPSVTVLIVLRVIQGIFGALLVPGALSIITNTFPKAERGPAIGKWTAWSSIAVIAAPFIGGGLLALLVGSGFLINVPLVIVCYVLGVRHIDESHDESPRRLDIGGAVLAWAGLTALTFGLIEGPVQHWNALTQSAVLGGVLLLLGFILWESKTKDPMVPLKLFRSRNFSGSNLMTFLTYGALGGLSFALVIYLETALRYPAVLAGLTLLPPSVLLMLLSSRVGKLAERYGARLFMAVGPIVAGLGIGWLYFLQPQSSFWVGILPGVLLFGFGLALLVTPLTATVMASAREQNAGIASGVNNAVARSAGLIVVALLGVVGGAHSFQFAMALCATMAILGGIVSYLMIRLDAKDLV